MKGYAALFDSRAGSLDDDDAEMIRRDHSEVAVLSRLPADQVDEAEVGPMFRIRFADGFEADAFRDELLCLHGDENAADCMVGRSDNVLTRW